ncbi:WD repeat-containing protein 89 [Rhagoletis pomonella]|uniref:WD repeat-containing protein 89 n=1 Tax=Rhagoletis pomonella TaxID=28610 RepID=UPI00177C8B9D|nr:WD repeat-containing protein 89 [Rhagoletis pomonella]
MKEKLISSGGEAFDSRQNSSNDDSEDTTNVSGDEDTCGLQEVNDLFQIKCKIADESAVSLRNDYVLSLAADSGFTRVAAGLSSATVHIFDINAQRTLSTLSDIPAPVTNERTTTCGVRFLDETPNCLLVGSSHGLVRLFDLRTQSEQARFEEDIEFTQSISNFRAAKGMHMQKTINCFDTNSNGRILCTGTNQSQGNVFLFFYDIRERKPLGAYFDSHEDDITALCFHATNPDLMCSGSTDGLINVYNLKEATEDDALLTTINTESSVQMLNWHKNVYEHDLISCITHCHDFHVYLADEADVVAKFEREKIAEAAKGINETKCNVIGAHSLENGDLFLLVGTNRGKSEVLRSLRLGKDLLPRADFIGNKQLVRASIFDQKSGTVATGGESGFVTLWTTENTTNDEPVLTSSSSGLKHKSKKLKKKTPY